MKVGFIGIGTMGGHMARNVRAKGYDVIVNDVRREAAAPHLKAGATWADSARKVRGHGRAHHAEPDKTDPHAPRSS